MTAGVTEDVAEHGARAVDHGRVLGEVRAAGDEPGDLDAQHFARGVAVSERDQLAVEEPLEIRLGNDGVTVVALDASTYGYECVLSPLQISLDTIDPFAVALGEDNLKGTRRRIAYWRYQGIFEPLDISRQPG